MGKSIGHCKGLSKHKQVLKAMNGKKIETGWFSSNMYPTGIKVAQVAYWAEFGTKTSPARPFMRLAQNKVRQNIHSVLGGIAGKIVDGKINPLQGLKQIGLYMEGQIVDSIKNGGWAANSDITVNGTTPDKYGNQFIKGKGFNAPLIDTGLMWQSVSSLVS